MKKSRVLLMITAISIALLTFGVAEVGGKHSDRADAHEDVGSRIKAAVERGDITPEQGRERLESFRQRGEKDVNWQRGSKRRLIKEFGVTEDQLAAIKDLRKRQREDVKALRKRYHEAFLNILTDEQRQKWEEKMRGRPVKSPDGIRPLRRPRPEPSDDVIELRDKVGKALDVEGRNVNTSAQEITWGELKRNN